MLRLIADLAGMPAGGGRLLRLRRLGRQPVGAGGRARDAAKRRPARPRPDAAGGSRSATDAHSSIVNTLRIMEVDPLVVRTDDHRLTGDGAARGRDRRRRRPRSIARRRGDVGHHQRRHHRRPGRRGRRGRANAACGSTWTARTAAPACSRRASGPATTGSSTPTPSSWIRTSGCSRPFDCAALLYATRQLARSVHTQDASYLDVIHDTPGEWNPTDYAYHLTRRARGLPLWFSLAVHGIDAYTRGDRDGARGWPARPPRQIAVARQLELIREPELVGGAVPPPRLDAGRLRSLGRPAAARPDRVRPAVEPGKARPWPGSLSCIPTPRWTWSGRSSTGWTVRDRPSRERNLTRIRPWRAPTWPSDRAPWQPAFAAGRRTAGPGACDGWPVRAPP